MSLLRHTLAIAASAALGATAVPAAAQAAAPIRAEPLVDRAPVRTGFNDRVLTGTGARASAARVYRSYSAAADGTPIAVSVSSRYAADAAIPQSYADFLGGLEHGSELAQLRVHIATPSEVVAQCGGTEGVLACYDSSEHLMTVPGEQSTAGGVTTSYVVAHEYGHHVAAMRSNAPLSALDLGPKRWASYERTCSRSLDGKLFPGDEADHYLLNPGENWAETYAKLKYPAQRWSFASLLEPDVGAYAAARQDVRSPWTRSRTKTFRGTFSATGAGTRSFALALKLDGALRVQLEGPSGTNYDLALTAQGRRQGTTSAAGSRDRLRFSVACRQAATERLRVTVRRVRGSGPFTATVTYAG